MGKRKSTTVESLEAKRARLSTYNKSLEEYSLSANILRDRERKQEMDNAQLAADKARKARNELFSRYKKKKIATQTD
jgi:hypothetical protein